MKNKGTPESLETPWIHPGGGALYRIAVRYLADGEWHEIERVIQHIIPKVHPAKATRRAERNRSKPKGKSWTAPPERTKNNDMDRIIRIGARSMAREALRNRAFEIDNKTKRVRIRPVKLDSAKVVIAQWEAEGGEAAFHDVDDEE